MNIKTAVARFDRLYPNTFTYEEKVIMLSVLDGTVTRRLRAFSPDTGFSGYTLETPGATVLKIPFPFDTLYIDYMLTELYKATGDTEKYNNAARIFENGMKNFENSFVNSHLCEKNQRIKLAEG